MVYIPVRYVRSEKDHAVMLQPLQALAGLNPEDLNWQKGDRDQVYEEEETGSFEANNWCSNVRNGCRDQLRSRASRSPMQRFKLFEVSCSSSKTVQIQQL